MKWKTKKLIDSLRPIHQHPIPRTELADSFRWHRKQWGNREFSAVVRQSLYFAYERIRKEGLYERREV